MSLSFRPAASADGINIVKLLDKSPAKGRVRIIYTRRPDAYASFQREAPDARVFVWESDLGTAESDQIAGVVASLTRPYHVGGQILRGTYIGGLKKDPDVHQRLDLASAFTTVADTGADFAFCAVLTDNLGIVAAFQNGHRVPAGVRPLGDLTTFLIKSGGRGCRQPGRHFRACQPGDEPALTRFYDRLTPQLGLFPAGVPWADNQGLSLGDFSVVTDPAGSIVAAGALWDQTDYRQYVIAGYSPLLNLARLLNPLFSLAGYPQLPRPDTVVAMPMACFLVAEPGEEEALAAGLLRQAKQRGYAQMVAGPAHSSAFYPCFASRRHVSFDSTIYLVLPTDHRAVADVPDISGLQCAYL